MKTKSFIKRRHQQSGELSLQITSMADIFTILLIFLLKGYATDAATLTPPSGVTLPAGSQSSLIREALKIEVTATGVLVESSPVMSLNGFAAENQNAWQALSQSLQAAKKKQEQIAAANPDVSVHGRFTLVADQKAPWPTLREVLRIAADSGFTEPQLAVVKKGE